LIPFAWANVPEFHAAFSPTLSLHPLLLNHINTQGNGFSRTDGLMGSTMRRLNKMLTTSSSRHMLWLVAFVVFVFIFVYYIIRHKG